MRLRRCYSAATMSRFNLRSLIAGFLVLAVLAGCASSGGKPDIPKEELPSDPNALVLGAELALQRGEHLEASRAYLRAAQTAESEELAEQATRVAYEHGHWSIVLAAAERWLELNGTNEQGRRFAGLAALHLYRIDRAAEHFGILLDTAFINPQAGFLALLPQLSDEVSPAAVAAVFQALIGKYDNLTEAHYALGQSALRAENFALAYQHAQRARELGPYWAPAALLLARVHLARGENDAGLEIARKVVEENDQDSYRLEYALMLLQSGKEDEGRNELSALASSETAAPVVERTLADIDFQLGNYDAAAQRFGNLVSSGRFVYESMFFLGAIAESRDAKDDALQIYERVAGSEFAMAAQLRAARIKIEREGLSAGLKHLEEFGTTRPQFKMESISARARLLADHGDRQGALALLDAALKEYPDATELRFTRVFQLEEADKVKAAIDELRKLVAERPNDPAATNALGYTLVDRTRQHREGLKYIEQALQVTPDSGAILDSMGWALHRMGRSEEALPYLEHARRRINDPEVELHLGEVLAALGRKDEALEVVQKANERYPDNADLQKQLKKLSK
jgi:tetratricopeptide (TPR) repeat protein